MRMLVNSDKGGCAELSSPALLFSVLFGFVCFYGVYIPWRTECKENLIEIRPETGWALRRRLMLVSKQLAGQSRRNHQLSHWPCWSDLYLGLFSEALHSSCAPRSWGSGRVIPQLHATGKNSLPTPKESLSPQHPQSPVTEHLLPGDLTSSLTVTLEDSQRHDHEIHQPTVFQWVERS